MGLSGGTAAMASTSSHVPVTHPAPTFPRSTYPARWSLTPGLGLSPIGGWGWYGPGWHEPWNGVCSGPGWGFTWWGGWNGCGYR
jgi:hypothetical protein